MLYRGMKLWTSYFYTVRFFRPNQIPLSTAIWDPKWYHAGKGQTHAFVDRRGVLNGLRAEALHPGKTCEGLCLGKETCGGDPAPCRFMTEYQRQLESVDAAEYLKELEKLGDRAKSALRFEGEPEIVLLVHEAPDNECSEQSALQKKFGCAELQFKL